MTACQILRNFYVANVLTNLTYKYKLNRVEDNVKTMVCSLKSDYVHKLIENYKSVFHPQHSILLSLKHSLAQLYGRVEGYEIDELPDLVLERKADFCRLMLRVLDVLIPGESRMRGMVLYELHAPIMFIARNEFSAGTITQEKLKERLQEPIKCLEEASRILMREDPQSPEGITGLIAQQSMEQLKASLDAL